MTYCGQCGNPLESDSKFCGSCGAPVPEREGDTRKNRVVKAAPSKAPEPVNGSGDLDTGDLAAMPSLAEAAVTSGFGHDTGSVTVPIKIDDPTPTSGETTVRTRVKVPAAATVDSQADYAEPASAHMPTPPRPDGDVWRITFVSMSAFLVLILFIGIILVLI